MFIYSVRAGTLKFVGVICVALVALITIIAFVPSVDGTVPDTEAGAVASGEQSIRYDKVKGVDDVAEFLGQFGWKVSDAETASEEVSIPKEFDKIFAAYNELQKRQGLDLTKYKGKNVQRYTYEITNYDGESGKVYVNVIVYRNKVIGGDVCSANVGGFIHGFEK